MFGQNVQLPVVNEPDALQITSVFPTLQGEGPLVGMRAIFVRAGGCNLACDFCDTDFDKFQPFKARELAEFAVQCAADAFGTVNGDPMTILGRVVFVITGGEPARQNFSAFIDAVRNIAIRCEFIPYFQIETSGTLVSAWMRKLDCVVISPKTPKIHPKFKELSEQMNMSFYLKYVVDAGVKHVADLVPLPIGMSWTHHDIYIQPIEAYRKDDSGRMIRDADRCQSNLEAAIALVKTDGRFRLCLQTHKMVGLP